MPFFYKPINNSTIMKRLSLFVFGILVSVLLSAQNKEATKFMGIPIDGTKNEMRKHLEAKGFVWNSFKECLEGEFNGTDVDIYIVTNKNKVWRIYLEDRNPRDEYQIKLRYNTLCKQFKNNSRYVPSDTDQTIPMDEDISYEMVVNDKHYEASFHQISANTSVLMEMADKYKDIDTSIMTEEELAQLCSDVMSYLILCDEEKFAKYGEGYFSRLITMSNENRLNEVLSITEDLMSFFEDQQNKNLVWFTINKRNNNRYYISMYYDNGYNEASGEDL